jgi:hypothetical protein
METTIIKVSEHATGNLDHEDGRRLHAAIMPALNAGRNVSLDFSGMDIITPSVLNTSLCAIAKDYGQPFLKSRISIVNSTPSINRIIRDALTERNVAGKEEAASPTSGEEKLIEARRLKNEVEFRQQRHEKESDRDHER